ncbi:MAG: hypothetical protein AAFO70_01885, partial [Pseudomonadota bacterium]
MSRKTDKTIAADGTGVPPAAPQTDSDGGVVTGGLAASGPISGGTHSQGPLEDVVELEGSG